MAQCIANVLRACADPNQEELMRWLSPAFHSHPDMEALNDSGHRKFKSTDVKLGAAMTAMLRAGSDKAAELYLEVNRKANEYVRSFEGKIIKGRQIVAMMYESFRTRDRLDMIVTLDYLIKLQYEGDNKLHQFKQTWLEILSHVRPEDVPSEKALRDCLYNKIKDSQAMKWELGLHYENLTYDHPNRSYSNLLNIIDRTIVRRREQSNLAQTQVGLRQMLEGKDLLAAPAKTQDKNNATPAPKGRNVTFAKDVKFHSSKPRKSYKDMNHEIVKVNMKAIVEDEGRAIEVEFKHKARLKAQIMKDMLEDDREGDRFSYVRMPGTSKVAEVAFYDGEDQMMERNLNVAESKKVIDGERSGCGHDLISQKKIAKRDLETLVTPEPISFQTANGITDTDLVSNFQTESFAEPINAYVLDDTPLVLSIGKRCMNQNYGFVVIHS
eukprot:s148_g24.t1